MIYGDKKYEQFIKRLYEALRREKFKRVIPYNETPSNTPSARRAPFGYSRKLKGLGIGKPTSPIFSVAADVIFVCNYLLSTVEKIAPSY